MSEHVQELIAVLQQELGLQTELVRVLDGKLDAMGRYDMTSLQALSQREQSLVASLQGQEQRRRQAVQQASRALLHGRSRVGATARQLAQAAPEPQRSLLVRLAQRLREAVEKARRLNRINEIATRKILGHVDDVFRIIARSGCDIGLYGQSGRRACGAQNRLVDALA